MMEMEVGFIQKCSVFRGRYHFILGRKVSFALRIHRVGRIGLRWKRLTHLHLSGEHQCIHRRASPEV